MAAGSTPPEPTGAQQRLAQNLLLASELGPIARSFGERSIELAVLKGVPLTRRLHGGLERRVSVDNDLLVRRAEAPRAYLALRQLGYESAPGRSLDADLASTFQHPMRRKGPAEAILRAELHWHAFPPHLFDVPEAALWSRLSPVDLNGQTLWVFDECMTLLHLASHHVQHRCAELKVLRDVGAAWERWRTLIDRTELLALAGRFGLLDAVIYSVDAARRAGFCSEGIGVASTRAGLLRRLIPVAHEGGEPGYRSLLGSVLLASPTKLTHALTHELLPPLPILARIYDTQPTRWLYARYPLRALRPLKALLNRLSKLREARR